jgi:hypothetical protein
LLLVLRARGFRPTEKMVEKIRGLKDQRQLDAWLRAAARVERLTDLFEGQGRSRKA